jgi:replicative DNA helicase
MVLSIPYSEEFEKAVIVAILTDPRILSKVQGILAPEDFYREDHKEIFRVITDIGVDNIDSLTIEDRLRDKTKDYFKTLVEDSDKMLPSLSNATFYAESIKAKSKLRSGIDLGQKIIASCYQPTADAEAVLADLEQMFSEFIQKRVIDTENTSTKEQFKEFVNNLVNRVNDTSGTRSGFYDLDLILHRLEGLIILAARPGMGKTALAINIARNVAQTKPVLFFSLEQAKEQIFERMLAAESEVSLEEIKTGSFIGDRMVKLSVDTGRDSLLKVMEHLHVDDTPSVNTSYIASVTRQKMFEWGSIGLIVVDYLHIMSLPEGNKVDTLGDAVKQLRALGKELDCPVLLLSQLSRQTESDERSKVKRRPRMSDLRSSGEIEQSADVVLFIYRDSYYQEPGLTPDVDNAEIIVSKQRNGRQGIVPIRWYPAFTKFKNL